SITILLHSQSQITIRKRDDADCRRRRRNIKNKELPILSSTLVPCDSIFGFIPLLRHPNILSFLHSTEVETHDDMFNIRKGVVGGSGTGLKDLPYNIGDPYTSKLAAGRNGVKRLRTVRHPNILSFLHSTEVETHDGTSAKVHGNVCLATVVVTPTLDWKLHAFDVLSEFDGSKWTYAGCLIYELFSGSKLGKTEELRNTTGIPKSLLPDYQRLLSSMPSRRLNTSKLVENGEYFQNKLVDTIHFMDILNLKDSVEKDTFFRKLPNVAEQLPREIVEVRSKAFQAVEQFLEILKQNYEKVEITAYSLPLFLETNSGETGGTGGASAIPETAGLIGNGGAKCHHTRSNSDFTDQPAPPSPTSTDGWGDIENGISEGHDSDKDGWDLDPIDEPKPAPALSNIQAAQKRPVSQPSRPPAQESRPKINSARAAAKYEDDDLWGSIAAPQPATTSRPKTSTDDEVPWAAIAAPTPTSRAKPLSSGRGRVAKPAAPRLGAQRINRTSS
ncbi:LOW QUALITY PROTEIN: hypothetical protein HID58_058072, partial [Brassica napus]